MRSTVHTPTYFIALASSNSKSGKRRRRAYADDVCMYEQYYSCGCRFLLVPVMNSKCQQELCLTSFDHTALFTTTTLNFPCIRPHVLFLPPPYHLCHLRNQQTVDTLSRCGPNALPSRLVRRRYHETRKRRRDTPSTTDTNHSS